MATRRMKSAISGVMGTLLTLAWLMGIAAEVGAETMKIKVSNFVPKGERVQIGDVPGHSIQFVMREGSMALENGETGSMKAIVALHTVQSGAEFLGYVLLNFSDGSTIVMSLQPGKFIIAPEGEFAGPQEAKGELLSGSGRFTGIKGTMNMTGKVLRPTAEEFAGKAQNEFILNYTLPPK